MFCFGIYCYHDMLLTTKVRRIQNLHRECITFRVQLDRRIGKDDSWTSPAVSRQAEHECTYSLQCYLFYSHEHILRRLRRPYNTLFFNRKVTVLIHLRPPRQLMLEQDYKFSSSRLKNIRDNGVQFLSFSLGSILIYLNCECDQPLKISSFYFL